MRQLLSNYYVRLFSIVALMLLVLLMYRQIFFLIDSSLGSSDPELGVPGFNDAEKFIKYGHPEIKSLSMQFLTLLTAILVFSLTFSEKIINYNNSTNFIRGILITGWTLLILAIIADGIGLAYNAIALPTALADLNDWERNNSTKLAFYEPAFISLKSILMSGAFFIGGLICIVCAGVASLISQARYGPKSDNTKK